MGYVVSVEGRGQFDISALGSRLFIYFPAGKDVGQAVLEVFREIEDSAAGRAFAEECERDTGRPFVGVLTDGAFVLIRDLVRSGAFTVEPKRLP